MAYLPTSSSPLVSGGAPTANQQQPMQPNQGGLAQMPEGVAGNIAAYNPYSSSGAAGDQWRGQAISNYRGIAAQNQQGMPQGQQWSPWALNAQSAGGYGGMANQVGNLFGAGGGQNIQAGRNFHFGSDASQVMGQDMFHDPMTGKVMGYGQDQLQSNPGGSMYSGAVSASQRAMAQLRNPTHLYGDPNQNAAVANTVGGMNNQMMNLGPAAYYASLGKNFGTGQFDSSSFSQDAVMKPWNDYQSASNGLPGQQGHPGFELNKGQQQYGSINQPNYFGR